MTAPERVEAFLTAPQAQQLVYTAFSAMALLGATGAWTEGLHDDLTSLLTRNAEQAGLPSLFDAEGWGWISRHVLNQQA